LKKRLTFKSFRACEESQSKESSRTETVEAQETNQREELDINTDGTSVVNEIQ